MVNDEVTSPPCHPAPPFPLSWRGKQPPCHKAELPTTRPASPWYGESKSERTTKANVQARDSLGGAEAPAHCLTVHSQSHQAGGPAGQLWGMEQSPTTSGCEDMQLLSDPLQVCHMEGKRFPLHMNPSWLSPGGRKEPPYCVFPIFGSDGNSKQGPGYLSEWPVKMTPSTSPTHMLFTPMLGPPEQFRRSQPRPTSGLLLSTPR